MFACFLTCIRSFSSSDSIKFMYKPNDDGAAFDLKVNGKNTSEKGWFVCFRIHNDTSIGDYNYKFNENGIAEADNFKVHITHSIDPKTNYTLINLQVTNTGEKRTFDLGVFADAKYGDFDNAGLTYNNSNVGSFSVTHNNSGYSVLLISQNSLPDAFYLGNESYSDPTQYPFFNKNNVGDSYIGDSCFAFSWQNQSINQNGNLNFQITVGADIAIYSPPIIVFPFDVVAYNETSNISLNILSLNNDDNVSVEVINSIGPNSKYNFTTLNLIDPERFDKNINQTQISVTPKENFWIKVIAKCSVGLSVEINQSIIVTKRPELNVTSKINKFYKNGSYIDISGTVYDDTNAIIFFILDLNESEAMKLYKKFSNDDITLLQFFEIVNNFYSDQYPLFRIDKTCNDKIVSYNKQILIPNTLESGNHTLNVYTLDEYNFMSNNYFEFNFSYDNSKHAPELQNINMRSNQTQPGQTVLITGQVREENYNGNLTIYAEIEGHQYYNLTILQSNENWVNFSGNVTIPSNIKPGEYKFNIHAKDDDGVNSRNQTLPFSVYIPVRTPSNTVPPPSSTPVPIKYISGGDAKKNYTPIYVAVPLCLIAIIVIVVALYFKFRHAEHSEEESHVELEETVIGGEDSNFVTLDNPIFTTTALHEDDDPFADDFEEGNTNKYFYTYQH